MLLSACGDGGGAGEDAGAPDAAPSGWVASPSLPVPVANNAVAAVRDADGCTVYSAVGIHASLRFDGITTAAYAWRVGDAAWTALADVSGDVGRVAASAVGLRGTTWSRRLGAKGDAACASGYCEVISFAGSMFGICSECRTDDDFDTAAGEVCAPTSLDIGSLSITPRLCEAP